MKLGVVFPQTEIGSDPAVVRDYAQAAESAGYDHLLVFDHVLGGKLERFDKLGRTPPYTDESPFHEVFVLFGFLGACTQKLELVTGIVILPQRQTALVAKQAAAVDVLTRGRLRLGVGIGWNHVEYEALNEDFHTRGRRVSEQIAVMRKLWTAWSPSGVRTITSTAPGSIRCPSSAPSPCGWAAWRNPCSSAWRRSPTAGSPSSSRATRRATRSIACART